MIQLNIPFGNAEVTINGNCNKGQISYFQTGNEYNKVPSKDSALLELICDYKPKSVQLTASNSNACNYPVFVELSDEDNTISIKMGTSDLPEIGTGFSWYYLIEY